MEGGTILRNMAVEQISAYAASATLTYINVNLHTHDFNYGNGDDMIERPLDSTVERKQ